MMRLSTVLKLVLSASTLVGVGLGIAVLAAPIATIRFQALLAASGTIAGHAVIALGAITAIERGKARRWMIVALVLTVLGLLGWLSFEWAWLVRGASGAMVRSAAIVLSGWALLLMIAGVALCQPANRRLSRGVQRLTVGLVVVMMLMLPAIEWLAGGPFRHSDVPLRLFSTIGVLAISGLAANMLLARIGGLAAPADASREGLRLTLHCPRCGVRQGIRLDGASCAACGLRIKVQMP